MSKGYPIGTRVRVIDGWHKGNTFIISDIAIYGKECGTSWSGYAHATPIPSDPMFHPKYIWRYVRVEHLEPIDDLTNKDEVEELYKSNLPAGSN